MNDSKGWEDVKKEFYNIILNIKRFFFEILTSFFQQIQLFSYSKVLVNIVLTFLFPIIMFSIPILVDNTHTLADNIMMKLSSGVLFSTSISISATIISSYVDSARDDGKKIKVMTKVLPLLIYSFMCTVLGAYYFGQMTEKASLNLNGVIIQIILYLFVQIIYGVMDSKIKNSPSVDLNKNEKDNEAFAMTSSQQIEALYDSGQNIENNINGKKI